MSETGSDNSKQDLERLRRLVSELEGEVASLRRRLHDAPKRVRMLEERLADTKGTADPGRVPERAAHDHAARRPRAHRLSA